MGFPTAFISSLTLTSSILYLSLLYHQQNRQRQASLLRQQSLLLNSLIDSPPPHSPDYNPETSHGRYPPAGATYTPDDPYVRFRGGGEGYRVGRLSMVEKWKDMWNRDVEGAWRWVLGTDVGKVREGLEKRIEDWREGERRI